MGLGRDGSIIIALTESWHSSLPKLPAGDEYALAALFGRCLMEFYSTGGSWRIPDIAFPLRGLSANVFSLAGYDLILSDIFQRAKQRLAKTPSLYLRLTLTFKNLFDKGSQ